MKQGKQPVVILGLYGGRRISSTSRSLRSWAATSSSVTNDGSQGVKGFVSDVMIQAGLTNLPYFACGPMPMLQGSLDEPAAARGQLSFEERMGCGFGACMGCSCKTKYGNKRICKDGPVLEREEIVW